MKTLGLITCSSRLLRWGLFFALFLTALPLQGCILAPIVEGVRQSGVTKGDRMALLPEEVKKFNDSLSWRDSDLTLKYVTDTGRREILEQLKKQSENEHIVESRTGFSEFSDDAYDATLQVAVKYYLVPYYIVKERREEQRWKFSLTEGWKLDSRKISTQ